MERYEVRIYPSAVRDLNELIDSINMLPPEAAISFYDEIIEKTASLSELPLRCPAPRDPLLAVKGYRYLAARNYLVFFTVKDGVVQIRRILYAKRDYVSVL